MTAAQARRGRHMDPTAVIELLGKVLRGTASLPGAACRGDARFTSDELDDDQEQAARICSRCPELTACKTWLESLPASRRPPGVTAGFINQPRPSGRPKKGKSA